MNDSVNKVAADGFLNAICEFIISEVVKRMEAKTQPEWTTQNQLINIDKAAQDRCAALEARLKALEEADSGAEAKVQRAVESAVEDLDLERMAESAIEEVHIERMVEDAINDANIESVVEEALDNVLEDKIREQLKDVKVELKF